MMKKKYIQPRTLAVQLGLQDNINDDIPLHGSETDDEGRGVKEENPWWGEDGSSSTTTSKSLWDEEW